MPTVVKGPKGYLTIQFLTWLSEAPRSYRQAMDAWRSTCPQLSIWEDALDDGLIRRKSARAAMGEAEVVVTERGKALLERQNN